MSTQCRQVRLGSCYFEQNMFLVKSNAEFSRKVCEEAEAALALPIILLAAKNYYRVVLLGHLSVDCRPCWGRSYRMQGIGGLHQKIKIVTIPDKLSQESGI